MELLKVALWLLVLLFCGVYLIYDVAYSRGANHIERHLEIKIPFYIRLILLFTSYLSRATFMILFIYCLYLIVSLFF